MNWQGLDRTEALGNFEMLTSIDELLNGGSTDCTGATQDVDQIAEARAAAALVDGCTVDGTNDPCSVLSNLSLIHTHFTSRSSTSNTRSAFGGMISATPFPP